MSFWNSMRVSSAALSAQQLRLDLISNNIANSQTTSTEDGGPYQRQDVVFKSASTSAGLPDFIASRLSKSIPVKSNVAGVQVAKIVTDDSEGALVYDPEHPDADEEGYVAYPNVDIVTEMTNMLSATRSYEANLAMVDAAKSMAMKALNIGR